MHIHFSSDYLVSNPGLIFDTMLNTEDTKLRGHKLTYRARDYTQGNIDSRPDISITDNIRSLEGRVGKLTINTHHGNFFLGDTQPEPGIDISLAQSESEKQMMVRNGYRPGNVFVTGAPRQDRLFKLANNPWIRSSYLSGRNLDPNKRTILYAPTYDRRNFGVGQKGFFANWVDKINETRAAIALMESIERYDYNLIIRVHGYYKRTYPNLVPDHLVNILKKAYICSHHDEPDSFPVLVSSDVLITDYSSIVSDFLPMRRPILFIDSWEGWVYTHKWHASPDERYKAGHVINNYEEFDTFLKSPSVNPKIDDTIEKFVPMYDGGSSQRAVKAILGEYRRING